MSQHIATPDFYFVTPHGTGTFSVAHYLRSMGIGVIRQNTSSAIRECIAGQTHRLGLNIDCAKPSTGIEKICTEQALPTVWLVRDPIDLLCSNYNFCISRNIMRCSTWRLKFPAKHILPDLLLEYLIMGDAAPFCCHYSSQLLKVKPSSLLCLDTSELSPKHIEKSLLSIYTLLERARELNLDTSLIKKSFNSFESRLQIFFSYLYLDSHPDICIHIYSKDYFSYMQYLKLWTENIRLFGIYDVEIDEKKYTVALQCDSAELVLKSLKSIIFQIEKSLPNYIRMRNSYLENVSSTLHYFKATPERILEMLEADKKLKKNFLRLQREELRLVKKFRPDLVERWTSFAQIGADIW